MGCEIRVGTVYLKKLTTHEHFLLLFFDVTKVIDMVVGMPAALVSDLTWEDVFVLICFEVE